MLLFHFYLFSGHLTASSHNVICTKFLSTDMKMVSFLVVLHVVIHVIELLA